MYNYVVAPWFYITVERLLPELHACGEHLDHEGCEGDDPTPAPLGVVVLPEGTQILFHV